MCQIIHNHFWGLVFKNYFLFFWEWVLRRRSGTYDTATWSWRHLVLCGNHVMTSCYQWFSCWAGLNFQWSFSYYFRLILNNRQKAVNNSRRSQTLKLSSEVARSHAQIDKVILLLVERSLWIASIFKEYFCFSEYEYCDGEEKCMIRWFFLFSNRAPRFLIWSLRDQKNKLKYNET